MEDYLKGIDRGWLNRQDDARQAGARALEELYTFDQAARRDSLRREQDAKMSRMLQDERDWLDSRPAPGSQEWEDWLEARRRLYDMAANAYYLAHTGLSWKMLDRRGMLDRRWSDCAMYEYAGVEDIVHAAETVADDVLKAEEEEG